MNLAQQQGKFALYQEIKEEIKKINGSWR
jgi:hypothetical protein